MSIVRVHRVDIRCRYCEESLGRAEPWHRGVRLVVQDHWNQHRCPKLPRWRQARLAVAEYREMRRRVARTKSRRETWRLRNVYVTLRLARGECRIIL